MGKNLFVHDIYLNFKYPIVEWSVSRCWLGFWLVFLPLLLFRELPMFLQTPKGLPIQSLEQLSKCHRAACIGLSPAAQTEEIEYVGSKCKPTFRKREFWQPGRLADSPALSWNLNKSSNGRTTNASAPESSVSLKQKIIVGSHIPQPLHSTSGTHSRKFVEEWLYAMQRESDLNFIVPNSQKWTGIGNVIHKYPAVDGERPQPADLCYLNSYNVIDAC